MALSYPSERPPGGATLPEHRPDTCCATGNSAELVSSSLDFLQDLVVLFAKSDELPEHSLPLSLDRPRLEIDEAQVSERSPQVSVDVVRVNDHASA